MAQLTPLLISWRVGAPFAAPKQRVSGQYHHLQAISGGAPKKKTKKEPKLFSEFPPFQVEEPSKGRTKLIRMNISETNTVHPSRLYPEPVPHYLPVSLQVGWQAPHLVSKRLVMRIILPFNRSAICHHVTCPVNKCCLIQHWMNKIQMLKIGSFYQDTWFFFAKSLPSLVPLNPGKLLNSSQ